MGATGIIPEVISKHSIQLKSVQWHAGHGRAQHVPTAGELLCFRLRIPIEMNSYQAHITVESAGQLVLSGLPFKKGEKVRVMVETEQSFEARAAESKKRASELFTRVTSAIDNDERIPKLTDEEIAKEIEAYRRGE